MRPYEFPDVLKRNVFLLKRWMASGRLIRGATLSSEHLSKHNLISYQIMHAMGLFRRISNDHILYGHLRKEKIVCIKQKKRTKKQEKQYTQENYKVGKYAECLSIEMFDRVKNSIVINAVYEWTTIHCTILGTFFSITIALKQYIFEFFLWHSFLWLDYFAFVKWFASLKSLQNKMQSI